MRRRLVVLVAVVATAAVAAFASPAQPASTTPVASEQGVALAHKCSSSRFKHAVMPNGSHKCLKAGQFCRKAWERTYRRHGFTCKPGSDGRYRLRKLNSSSGGGGGGGNTGGGTGGNCHPSYTGACLDPSVSDYDCAGGSGNGPGYTGTVNVVGPDEYGLDADGDGVGCE